MGGANAKAETSSFPPQACVCVCAAGGQARRAAVRPVAGLLAVEEVSCSAHAAHTTGPTSPRVFIELALRSIQISGQDDTRHISEAAGARFNPRSVYPPW